MNIDKMRNLNENFEVLTFAGGIVGPGNRTYEDLIKAISPSDEFSNPGSKQLELAFDRLTASNEVIAPPINLDLAATMIEKSTRLNRAIHTYARNVVGLGWHIVPTIDLSEATDQEKERFKREKALLTELFDNPNGDIPLVTLLFLVKLDQEATGNGYIEVVRDGKGQIEQLYHMPSVTVRVRCNGDGFVQIVEEKKRYFKVFGDQRPMNAETGEVEGNIALDNRATEVIHFKIPCVRSSFYGLPRWVPAIPAITGNRLASIRNVVFFENDSCPRLIITISGGGRLSSESVDEIRKFLQVRSKGVEQAHRVAVIQLDTKKPGATDNAPKAQIDITPLTVGTTEDASFLEYRRANDEEIREAFGIGKVFFTLDDVSRAGGKIARMITNESEFEPDRIDWEYQINMKIVKDLGAKLAKFKLARPDLSDPLEAARIDKLLSDAAALTPNDIRSRHNLPNFPDEFVFANKPVKIAIEETKTLGKPLTLTDAAGLPEEDEEIYELENPETTGDPRRTFGRDNRNKQPHPEQMPKASDAQTKAYDLAKKLAEDKKVLEDKIGLSLDITVNGNEIDNIEST